jgi:hypothetical protein
LAGHRDASCTNDSEKDAIFVGSVLPFRSPFHHHVPTSDELMGRIVQTGDTPAKRRNMHRRSCAEVIRLLAERHTIDDEWADMVSFLVFSLRGIGETIEQSARAWDDRNYWKKAEALRHKWRWTNSKADEIGRMVVDEDWHLVSDELIGLIPHFADVTITTITRGPDWWVGARKALVKEFERPGPTTPSP